jgi:leucyl aminopeptidase
MIDTRLTSFKEWKLTKTPVALFAFQTNGDSDIQGFKASESLKALSALARTDGFKGREGDSLLVHPKNGLPVERAWLIGLGKREDFTLDVLRRAAARTLKLFEALGLKETVLIAPKVGKNDGLDAEFQALSEGIQLGAYRFDRYKTPAEQGKVSPEKALILLGDTAEHDLFETAKKAVKRGRIYSEGTMLARNLINEPPSRMNPETLAGEAKILARAGIHVTIHERKDLERMGMGAILGVGVGGAVPPRLVELLYKPSGKAKKVVALVGKGITFDSGGLSLKPAQSMETMKDDMSGAAAVIGVFRALSELKPSIEVRGYLAIAENMPGGRAQKPGDVVKAMNGKTIEVLNTDAEGRLVLSDALSYACTKKPDVIIDIATLTGACVVALGHLISAVMGNDKELSDAIIKAGEQAGEKFWPLPLPKEYQQDIKSKIADLKNIGGRRGEAGTLIGGLFLQEFVTPGIPWAHLDIAGPSWSDSDQPYCPTGGTGHPVRTLLRYIENLAS